MRWPWQRRPQDTEEFEQVVYNPAAHDRIAVYMEITSELARDVPIDVLARICGDQAAEQIKAKLREVHFPSDAHV